MPQFSQSSKDRLMTCDPKLQALFNAVIQHYDCTILCGHRNKEDQDKAFASGASKKQWPDGEHNKTPSRAIDASPHPIVWPTAEMSRDEYARVMGRWYMFVGYVRSVADRMGIKIRCGADWDGDFEVRDQNFHDLPHFELV